MEKQIKMLMTGTCKECGSPIVRDLYGSRMENVRAECVRCGTSSPLDNNYIRVKAECNNCLYLHDIESVCAVKPPFGHSGVFPRVSPYYWCAHHEFDPFRTMEDD